jgi:peptide-methionine (S)-S-oxide reductase
MLTKITLGAGCFWCLDNTMRSLKGVVSSIPGYTGGLSTDPSYEEVCSGNTGHVEVVEVSFDDEIITLAEVFELFWWIHDPTQLNRQGNDVGTQYRSAIFYHSEEQKIEAEKIKSNLESNKVWENSIVTTIEPLVLFYPAEEYHHDYFARNPLNQYCQFVVKPKIDKFKKVFSDRLK